MALPTLAPYFLANSIGIDPGITYYYVIGQTGATSFAVDPVTDFALSVDANGVLSVRWTGAVPTVLTSHVVTIYLTNASGTITQRIAFMVTVPTTTDRYYPSIISAASTNAGLNAPISYQIACDIPAGTRFAQHLPTGLTCDTATGIITGTPPATNATYAIALGAKRPGFTVTSLRFWILVVGAGSDLVDNLFSGSGTGGSFTPIGATSFTYKGTFTTPSLIAGPIYERPFQADPNPYVYHVQYRVALELFNPLPWDVPGPYGGIHVGESQWKNERGGILTFWRTFAIVPPARDEYESIVYAYQFWQISGGTGSIAEVPKHVNSRVQYDYFKTTTPAISIPVPRMPRVISLFGTLYAQNGYGSLVVGQEILAEDATYHRWHGNIYERKQRFIIEEGYGEQLQQ